MGVSKFLKNRNKNFCGLDTGESSSNFAYSKVVVLQCPYDLTASYRKGTKKGPSAIIDASANMELFDEEVKEEIFKIGIHTKPPMQVGNLTPEQMSEHVKTEVGKVLRTGKLPVLLGGEHSVSIGAVEAASSFKKNLSVLHIDAHHDLRNEYEGSKCNHACVARRFMENCRVVEVGARSLCKEEQDFIDTAPEGLKIFSMNYLLKQSSWKEGVVDALTEDVYVTIDLDAFDPSILPAVGTPEPGGLLWRDVLDLMKMVISRKNIVGFDVNELMPLKEDISSDFTAARLIYKMLGYIFFKEKILT